MKKTFAKLKFRKKEDESSSDRITSNTLAQHREQVLAGGRKFKYPVQYARHKLVINAIIITAVAATLLVLLGWYQLYVAQNTGDFMYRVTKVVPVSVASVDGTSVRYSNYLMRYRSSLQYLTERDQIDVRSDNGKRQLLYVKREEMNEAIAVSYAEKLAKELDITVTDAEVEEVLLEQQKRASSDGEVSEATYNATILDYYGWTPDEYRQVLRAKLLKQKVMYAVDDNAKELIDQAAKLVASGKSLEEATSTIAGSETPKAMYLPATSVPKDNQDGGLATAALALKDGAVSEPIMATNGDGWYIVRRIEATDTKVKYEAVRVLLYEFENRLTQLREDGKIKEYIDIEDPTVEEE